MNGAIFYSTRYGSTAQYAEWTATETGLPVFNVARTHRSPSEFDFLVLGSPVIYHKLLFHKWMKQNSADILKRPALLFSVSGTGAGSKLDLWIAKSLSEDLIEHPSHLALLGRQDPRELTWFDRTMLLIGGLFNLDPAASRGEVKGFDYMDRTSIGPIVEAVGRLKNTNEMEPA